LNCGGAARKNGGAERNRLSCKFVMACLGKRVGRRHGEM